jgi:transposase InsO family protein
MNNNKSSSTAKAIETHFMATMPPRLLQTDGGSEYQSHFKGKLTTYGVKHHLTVPHRPQSNGVAEAAVKLVKEGILRLITRAGESRKNWDELVGIVCVRINNSVMRTGMLSRAEAFLGQRHYHLMLRRYVAEDSDEVVFSLHNDAIKIGRMKQRGTVEAIVKNFKVVDLVKIKNHRMKKSDGSRFAVDPPTG